jgi:hypothetical protein
MSCRHHLCHPPAYLHLSLSRMMPVSLQVHRRYPRQPLELRCWCKLGTLPAQKLRAQCRRKSSSLWSWLQPCWQSRLLCLRLLCSESEHSTIRRCHPDRCWTTLKAHRRVRGQAHKRPMEPLCPFLGVSSQLPLMSMTPRYPFVQLWVTWDHTIALLESRLTTASCSRVATCRNLPKPSQFSLCRITAMWTAKICNRLQLASSNPKRVGHQSTEASKRDRFKAAVRLGNGS